MSEHLDLDALADLLAGVGDGGGHVAGCDACRARLAQLEEALPGVGASLASLAEPPEPADLADRISSALHAEQVVPSPTVVPLATRRRTRWLPALGAVAAAAVVALGAVLVVNQDDEGSQDDGATYALSSTGTDYRRDASSLASALPQLLEGGAPEAAPEIQTLATPDQASAGAPTPNADTRTTAESSDPLATLRTDEGLAACLFALSDPDDPDAGIPLALDYASFEGRPAMVVVLPTTTDEKVDVFVVGAGCSQGDAQLLFFTRLARP